MYDHLVQMENETGVVLPDSPTRRVGGEALPGFEPHRHITRMWSMDKAQSEAALREWAARAEKLWHDRNCPTGQDEAIWLEAESQLLAEAETRPVAGTPSRPYVDEPARQVSDRTKVQDPTGSAVQTRSETKPPKSKRSKQIRTQ
jgi:hypothetical protein